MTTAARLNAARNLLDQPAPAPVPGQLLLNEAIPDGTFGGPRPRPRWTRTEQAVHRAQLAAALGITDDYHPTTPAA